MLDGCIQEFLDLGEGDDLVEFLAYFIPGHAEDGAVEKDVFPSRQLGVEAGSDFKQARNSPAEEHAPFCGLCNPAQDLEQGALARTVAAADADDFSLLALEAHAPQCPELFNFVTLDNLPATQRINCLAREVTCLACEN